MNASPQVVEFNVRSSSGAQKAQVRPFPNRLFQTSTMAALLDAVYDGDVSVDELLKHGNFGLGTFNALDGEMIVDGGVVHQFRADGRAGAVPGDQLTPFACVTHFAPKHAIALDESMEKAELGARVARNRSGGLSEARV